MASSYEEFFRAADVDGSGYLTIDELAGVLKAAGYRVSAEDVQGMFSMVDENNDGKVTLAEFTSVMGQQPSAKQKAAAMRKIFAAFDTDGSGTIDKKEMAAAMEEMGAVCSKEEIQQIMAEGDKDGSGTLNYEEFIHLFDIE